MMAPGCVLRLLAVLALIGRHGTDGFAIRVDAHEEECFYEDTTTGTKVCTVPLAFPGEAGLTAGV